MSVNISAARYNFQKCQILVRIGMTNAGLLGVILFLHLFYWEQRRCSLLIAAGLPVHQHRRITRIRKSDVSSVDVLLSDFELKALDNGRPLKQAW